MKSRFKSWITSFIGICIWILTGTMFYLGKIDMLAFGSLMGLGYVFVVAKDSLLQGLSLGFYKKE